MEQGKHACNRSCHARCDTANPLGDSDLQKVRLSMEFLHSVDPKSEFERHDILASSYSPGLLSKGPVCGKITSPDLDLTDYETHFCRSCPLLWLHKTQKHTHTQNYAGYNPGSIERYLTIRIRILRSSSPEPGLNPV